MAAREAWGVRVSFWVSPLAILLLQVEIQDVTAARLDPSLLLRRLQQDIARELPLRLFDQQAGRASDAFDASDGRPPCPPWPPWIL